MNEAGREHFAIGKTHWTWPGVLCVLLAPGWVKAYAGAAPGIKVVDNQIVTTRAGTLGNTSVTAGEAVVLRGVNVTGSEYECLVGDSVWDSSSLPNASTTTETTAQIEAEYQTVINAIVAFGANVVRIPLNEDCWMDYPSSNPPPAATSGTNYSSQIAQFIKQANATGLIAEVDLHVGGGPYLVNGNYDNGCCTDSFPAMDTSVSENFWISVAQTAGVGNNPSVIFNLTNEPEFPNTSQNQTVAAAWSCYLNGGCSTKGMPNANSSSGNKDYWTVQGTQGVVTAIRQYATNPIIIAGINYSNELDDWLSYVPSDPDGQIIAGVHIYFDDIFCETVACWNSEFVTIQKAGYPVIIDETGELDAVKNTPATGDTGCGSGSEQTLTAWADALPTTEGTPQIGYWFWAFTYADWKNCTNGPDLLEGPIPNTNFTAWPDYGTFAESHLQSENATQ